MCKCFNASQAIMQMPGLMVIMLIGVMRIVVMMMLLLIIFDRTPKAAYIYILRSDVRVNQLVDDDNVLCAGESVCVS